MELEPDLGDEDGCHSLVERRTIHVHRRADGQDEPRHSRVNLVSRLQSLDRNWNQNRFWNSFYHRNNLTLLICLDFSLNLCRKGRRVSFKSKLHYPLYVPN